VCILNYEICAIYIVFKLRWCCFVSKAGVNSSAKYHFKEIDYEGREEGGEEEMEEGGLGFLVLYTSGDDDDDDNDDDDDDDRLLSIKCIRLK
jgi:hypothetical protein